MSASEFSRAVTARHLPAEPLVLEASEAERQALAERFGVVAIEALRAEVALEPDKDAVSVSGTLAAELVQTCAVSGEDFATRIAEPLALRFVPPKDAAPAEEIELDADGCDEIEFAGESFDLGEAIAQSLGLAIDPYATGPEAERVRREKGLSDAAAAGPFAALAALKKE